MKCVCIAVVSLLVVCSSAIDLAEPSDLHTCNVSETKICGNFRLGYPERHEYALGNECFDDDVQRRTFTGTGDRRVGDTFQEVTFAIFEFFRDFTLNEAGKTLRIPGRTRYVYELFNQKSRCDKYRISSDESYRKPGIPEKYICRGDFVEGWVDLLADDGIRVKYCNRSISTERGLASITRTATEIGCYPIRRSEFIRNSMYKVEILEERFYYDWQSPGIMQQFPDECWNP